MGNTEFDFPITKLSIRNRRCQPSEGESMKATLTAIALAFLLASTADAAVNIYGPGGMSCEKYNQATGPDKDAFKYWGQGYISGINSMKNFDLTRGKDPATVLSWIDAYCSKNPSSSYNGAVDSLILEINKGQ